MTESAHAKAQLNDPLVMGFSEWRAFERRRKCLEKHALRKYGVKLCEQFEVWLKSEICLLCNMISNLINAQWFHAFNTMITAWIRFS